MESRTAFRELPRSVQQEVERLARRGKRHPDVAVARSAYEWALSIRSAARSSHGSGATALAMDVLMQLVGGLGGIVSGRQLAVRILSKQLVKLGPPPSENQGV